MITAPKHRDRTEHIMKIVVIHSPKFLSPILARIFKLNKKH